MAGRWVEGIENEVVALAMGTSLLALAGLFWFAHQQRSRRPSPDQELVQSPQENMEERVSSGDGDGLTLIQQEDNRMARVQGERDQPALTTATLASAAREASPVTAAAVPEGGLASSEEEVTPVTATMSSTTDTEASPACVREEQIHIRIKRGETEVDVHVSPLATLEELKRSGPTATEVTMGSPLHAYLCSIIFLSPFCLFSFPRPFFLMLCQ